jgi:nucleoside-diphosphate-sugar epimerase
MNVLITGAGGFIGQALTAALRQEYPDATMTLTDMMVPNIPSATDQDKSGSGRITTLTTDLTVKSAVDDLFAQKFTHVYLLHGIMSGAAEANHKLGLKVNFDSMRLIADALSKYTEKQQTRVVFPSSLAVFGPLKQGQVVDENTITSPQSSYGCAKAMTELLLNDLTRRGALDALIVRLPTIIVRPGKPTGAASSFCSGIFREPLNGQTAILPVGDDLELWICSTRTIIKNLVTAGRVPADKLSAQSRIVNMPGITVNVGQMISALEEVGGIEATQLIDRQPDENVARIVNSWPARFDCSRALALDFNSDVPLDQALKDYISDYLP